MHKEVNVQIKVQTGDLLGAEAGLAVLGAFENEPLPPAVTALLEPGDFRGKAGETLLLYPRAALAPRRLLLVGLGPHEKATAETIRRVSATNRPRLSSSRPSPARSSSRSAAMPSA